MASVNGTGMERERNEDKELTDSSVREPEKRNKPPFVCAGRRGSPRRSGVGGLMEGVRGRVPRRVGAAPKVLFLHALCVLFGVPKKRVAYHTTLLAKYSENNTLQTDEFRY